MPHKIILIQNLTVFPKELHVNANDTVQYHANNDAVDISFDGGKTPIGVASEHVPAGAGGNIHSVTGSSGSYPYTATVNGSPIDPMLIVD